MTNATPIPASAPDASPCLSNDSGALHVARRAFLKGSAAVASTAALGAPTAVLADANPDSELMAMIHQAHDLAKAVGWADAALYAAQSAYWERVDALGKPAALIWRQSDFSFLNREYIFDGTVYCDPVGIERLRADLPALAKVGRNILTGVTERDRKRATDIVAAYDDHRATCDAIKSELRVDELELQSDTLSQQEEELIGQILGMPAKTLAGSVAKAKLMEEWAGGDLEADPEVRAEVAMGYSIARDLLAIAGTAP